MNRLFFTGVALLASTSLLHAQNAPAAIVGTWEADTKEARIEIFADGNHYNGRLLWGNKVVEKDGRTSKKDVNNPDEKLRSHNVIGMTTLTGLTWDGAAYTKGQIYDPPSGKTYSCKVWLEGNKLNLRGFMGLEMLGKTLGWHRYPVAVAR